jgi:methanogenic corrinoid protein MtbC1
VEHRLFSEAKALPAVSPAAALAYQDNREKLRLLVDRELADFPDILPLIGFSQLEMMKSNHRHHVQFMSMVFRHSAYYTLLPRVVVWVYRSYHNHGFSYNYFPRELRAWQRAVASQLGPAAAAEIERVYQWLLDHHQDFCELADSATYATFFAGFDAQKQMQILLTHMLNNNYRACIDLAVESVHSAGDLARFYQEVMTPTLYEIGRLWEEGEISAVQEHMATAISMRIMSAMYGGFVLGDASKGKAVITAAPNEYHEVGARMVSDQLEMAGWQVDYLGANSPATDLLKLLRQEPPFLLGFSIVVPFNVEDVHRIIEEIRADKVLKNLKILVGGPIFALEPELWRKIGADGYATNGGQAVELARQWWEEKTQ